MFFVMYPHQLSPSNPYQFHPFIDISFAAINLHLLRGFPGISKCLRVINPNCTHEFVVKSLKSQCYNIWLVVWNIFSIKLGMSSSQMIFIFFRGVGQPPTRLCFAPEIKGPPQRMVYANISSGASLSGFQQCSAVYCREAVCALKNNIIPSEN